MLPHPSQTKHEPAGRILVPQVKQSGLSTAVPVMTSRSSALVCAVFGAGLAAASVVALAAALGSLVSTDGSRCEQRGTLSGGAGAHVTSRVDSDVRELRVTLHNLGDVPLTYRLTCGEFSFESSSASLSVGPGMDRPVTWDLDRSYGWYDVVVTVDEDPSYRRRLTGHVRRPG